MNEYYRIQADIDLDAICGNIRRTREIIKPETKIMGIIKADGYGHGAIPVARALDPLLDAYGVATIAEAIELRAAGVEKPVLILGYTPPQYNPELVRFAVTPTIFHMQSAQSLSEEALLQHKRAGVHIKVDTGMSRIGFPATDAAASEVEKISRLPGIRIDGCFTHFAKADETDKSFTVNQIEKYNRFVEELVSKGVSLGIKHISNSAGIIDLPEANLDMVRSGISTYGLYPSQEVDKSRLFLEPAMSIRSHIILVKDLPPGTAVSYGGTYVTDRSARIATIPVGYGDGYKRALSNRGRVIIHGKFARILGRVCMDQFMVDVTHIPEAREGDRATLLGRDGKLEISVEELSALSNSFPYEFVCDIGKRVPRVYYYQGRKAGTMDYFHAGGPVLELPLLPEF